MANQFVADSKIVLAAADAAGHAASGHGATSAGTTQPAPHGNSDFPPFDAQYWTPQLVWLAIVFGLLYLLMSKIALPRVGAILEARAARIAGDLDSAQKARAEADAAAQAHDRQLTEARAKAQATAQETQARLAAEGDARRKALEGELATKLAAAEAQIAQTKARAMSNVSDIAADTAAAIVEHITGQPADRDRVAAAVKQGA